MKPTFLLMAQLLFVTVLLNLQSCSTGSSTSGASPVASVPLPEDGTITISSPDSEGLTLVTGSTNAVPANAVIVIEVSDASTYSVNITEILNELVNPAYATETCSSALPECPDLSSDNQCQFTANADGSFALQVPANASTEITIGYLDTNNSCAETFYEEAFTVDENLTAFALDIVDAADNVDDTMSTSQILLLGSTSSGSGQILIYETSDQSYTTGDDLATAISGNVQSLDVFEYSAGSKTVGIATDSQYFLANYYYEAEPSFSDTWVSIVPEDTSINESALYYAGQDDYTPSEIDTASYGGCYGDTNTRTRFFFYANDVDNSHLFILRSGFTPTSTSQNVGNIIVNSDGTVQRFLWASVQDDIFYAMGEFLNNSTGTTELVTITFSINDDFCGDASVSASVSASDYSPIVNTEAPENYNVTTISNADGSNAYLLFLNIDTQVLYAVSLADLTQIATFEIPAGFSNDAFNTVALVTAETVETDGNYFLVRLLASDGRGLGEVLLATSSLSFSLADSTIFDVVAVNPTAFIPIGDTNYIIDRGVEGDGVSTMLIHAQ